MTIGFHGGVISYVQVGPKARHLRQPSCVVKFPMCDNRVTPSKSAGKKRKATAAEDELDSRLKAELTSLRDTIAKEESKTVTAVFTVNQLAKMAKEKPLTPSDFANCEGVTEIKFERYHLRFLAAIRTFLAENGGPVPLQLEELPPKGGASSAYFGDATALPSPPTTAAFRPPPPRPTPPQAAGAAPRAASARQYAAARAREPAAARASKPTPAARAPPARRQHQQSARPASAPRSSAGGQFRGVTALHSAAGATTKKAKKSNL